MSYHRSRAQSRLSLFAALIVAVAFCACLSALPAYAEGEGDGADVPAAEQPAAAEGTQEGEDSNLATEDGASTQPADLDADTSGAVDVEPDAQNAEEGELGDDAGEFSPEDLGSASTEFDGEAPDNKRIPLRAQAEGIKDTGTIGTCEWTYSEDHCLTIKPADGIDEGVITGGGAWPWAKYAEDIEMVIVESSVRLTGDASYMFSGLSRVKAFEFSPSFSAFNLTSSKGMFYNCSSLESLALPESFDTSTVTDMSWMFSGCFSLESLALPESFDTSSVTDMDNMFRDCSKLASLTLPDLFSTWRVEDMNYMFLGCSSLTSLSLAGASFDTSSAVNMSGMFAGCSSLESLELPHTFDTSSATDMSGMFFKCESLTSLDLSAFNTSNVTNMEGMFSDCTSLSSLTFSDSFDTSSVTNMAAMFSGCASLPSLTLPESFDTSSVTNMRSMFLGCSSFDSPPFTGSFDTSSVTDMGEMFLGCSSLRDLDLSFFDTSNVTNMGSMFEGCSSLVSLDISSFDTSSVTSMSAMFCDDSSLDSLRLGSAFSFVGGEDARLVISEDGSYTGNWTDGEGNSVDLQTSYDGATMAGTWVRERNMRWVIVSGLKSSYPYTGSAVEPKPVFYWAGQELVEGTDYELSYSNNVDKGQARVIATGKGIYANSSTGLFRISAGASTVTLADKTETYTGDPIAVGEATVTGSEGAVTYAYYSDEACTQEIDAADVVDAGAYWVKASVEEDANHEAATSEPAKLTVKKAASSIELKAKSVTYTGKAVAIGEVVPVGSAGKVTYAYYSDAKCTKAVKAANVKNAGTYWVKATVAADANHDKATSAAVKLVVKPAKIASFKLAKTAVTYTGKPLKPKAVCKAKVAGKTVTVPATGLTVTYARNKAVGTATATIKGKGNYTGTKKIAFKVNPRPTALKSVSPYTIKSKAHYGNRGLKITWAAPKAECDGAEVQVLAYDAKSKSWKRVQGPYRCPTKAFGKARVKDGERFAAYTCTVGNKALKAKTKYRVQVRTYKVVAGAAYYSSWSLPKAATTSR